MSIDDSVKLIDALTRLLSALAWPVLVGFVLLKFAPSLKDFFQSMGEFSLKGAGFEASAKRRQVKAAAALAAAEAARPKEAGMQPSAMDARETLDLVQDAVTPRVLRRTSRAQVLWVDDRPDNNAYERQSLEALGITFDLATSTEEALGKLKARRYSAVISDMSRPHDPQAGYTLLERMRTSGDTTPFVIYASSNAPEHRAEARRRGALGCTNRAAELFEYVVRAIRASA